MRAKRTSLKLSARGSFRSNQINNWFFYTLHADCRFNCVFSATHKWFLVAQIRKRLCQRPRDNRRAKKCSDRNSARRDLFIAVIVLFLNNNNNLFCLRMSIASMDSVGRTNGRISANKNNKRMSHPLISQPSRWWWWHDPQLSCQMFVFFFIFVCCLILIDCLVVDDGAYCADI